MFENFYNKKFEKIPILQLVSSVWSVIFLSIRGPLSGPVQFHTTSPSNIKICLGIITSP